MFLLLQPAYRLLHLRFCKNPHPLSGRERCGLVVEVLVVGGASHWYRAAYLLETFTGSAQEGFVWHDKACQYHRFRTVYAPCRSGGWSCRISRRDLIYYVAASTQQRKSVVRDLWTSQFSAQAWFILWSGRCHSEAWAVIRYMDSGDIHWGLVTQARGVGGTSSAFIYWNLVLTCQIGPLVSLTPPVIPPPGIVSCRLSWGKSFYTTWAPHSSGGTRGAAVLRPSHV